MRTHDERLQLLKRFETECCGERTATEVATSLGVPISTMWRWRRNQHDLMRRKARALVDPADVSIECLCDNKEPSIESLMRSISAFMIWLRWPPDFEKYQSGVTVCILAYLADKFGDIKIDQLPPLERDIACRTFTVGSLSAICAWIWKVFPFLHWITFSGKSLPNWMR